MTTIESSSDPQLAEIDVYVAEEKRDDGWVAVVAWVVTIDLVIVSK